MPSEAQLPAQRRDCFPRLREGRLTALLAMTGIGAGPTIPSAREAGARHVARGLRIHPTSPIIPVFHYSSIPCTARQGWEPTIPAPPRPRVGGQSCKTKPISR